MTIDIMLPFYGDPEHFRQAVESIRAQADGNWRLTIVDDVYPDLAPGRWAAELEDERITYLRNETNLGVSRNYLKCVDLMQSPYAVIMGCDDVMLPGFIGRIRTLLKRFPDADVIQTGVEVIDENGIASLPLADRVKRKLKLSGNPPRGYDGEQLATNLLHANWTYFPSLCWKVETIRRYGFRADLDVVQDLQMLLQIINGGGSIVVDDDVNFQYRRHRASVSSHTAVDGTRFNQELTVFNEARDLFAARGWKRAARAASWHVTSRLNALSLMPTAARTGKQNVAALWKHIIGS